MTYSVSRTRAADKALAGIEKRDRLRIEGAIALLAETPRPPNATETVGTADRWRVRIGDYRVLYSIEDERLVVLVIRVAHRREVYR